MRLRLPCVTVKFNVQKVNSILTKPLLYLALIFLFSSILVAGCSTPCESHVPEKNFDCTSPVDGEWTCAPLVGNSLPFECSYINEITEPECVAIWCDLPIQSCDLPPLTGGTDSCENECSKPSPQWPNCIEV